MSAQKWFKFAKDAKDIPESSLEKIYENVQIRFDSGMQNPYDDLFRFGIYKSVGYKFYPISEKFICKLVTENEIKYIVGYAKDKETCETILNDYYSEDEDFVSLEVIKNPFTN